MQGLNTQELNFSISIHVYISISRWENQVYYEIIDFDFNSNFSNMQYKIL